MRCLLALALVACSSSNSMPPPSPPPSPVTPVTDGVHAVEIDGRHEVTSEDVSFVAGGRTIPGTLARPTGEGRWPAVLVLAGSGPTDRDWNSPLLAARNGSGALLATALAQHGAVVLRFDKAGSGKNPGPPPEAWTADTYRDEAAAALALLRARPDVRADRIFVAGHSEGGIHATRLAQVEPVAGIAYLASASRSLVETLLAQIEAQLKHPTAKLSERAVEAEMTTLRAAFEAFLAGRPVDPAKASKIPQLQALVAQLAAPGTAAVSRALRGFDNAAEAAKLTGPFFVLAGGKDIQVDPERDGRRLEQSLRDAGRTVTFHLAPDADHVLKHEPKPVAELRANLQAVQDGYNAADRTLDPDAVRALVGWLAEHTR